MKLKYKRFKPLNYKAEQKSLKPLTPNQEPLVNGFFHGFFLCFGLFVLLIALFFIINTFSSTSPSLPLESLLESVSPQKEIINLPENWASAESVEDLTDLCGWPIVSITNAQSTTINLLIQDEPLYADLTKDFNRYNMSALNTDAPSMMAAFLIKAYYTLPFSSESPQTGVTVNLCNYARDGFGREMIITHSSYSLSKKNVQSIDWTTITSYQLIQQCKHSTSK